MLLNMNSLKMNNSHFVVGLFIVTMILTLMFENYLCKVIGVFLGVSFMIYCEAAKWLKRMIKTIRICFEKVYEILRCIRFLQQNNVIESAKLNTEIKLLKKTLLELLQAKKKTTRCLDNNPGSVRGFNNQHASKKSNAE